jgi:hypothetical protein
MQAVQMHVENTVAHAKEEIGIQKTGRNEMAHAKEEIGSQADGL